MWLSQLEVAVAASRRDRRRMPPKRHGGVTVCPDALVAGPTNETLGVHALLDGPDGPRTLLSRPMPSTHQPAGEHRVAGIRRVPRAAENCSPGQRLEHLVRARKRRGWAMATTRGGDYVATVQEPTYEHYAATVKDPKTEEYEELKANGSRVVVVKVEWVCLEGTG